ncbi:MAG: putative sensor protein [Anaerosporomusa subterranea]|nr:putative sensor protein [Anaerosporomusa subterranea]
MRKKRTSDISERANTDTELRKLSTAVKQSPCSIVITDLEGNIEYVNPKFTAATGYTSTEALGQNPRVLKSGHQPPEVYKEMWDTITAGREWQGEFQNKRKNGSIFWELASISPIRNAEGKVTHYLAIKEDITPRKQVEDMIRRDMELASRIQRGFLPPDLDNEFLAIHNIYQPYQHVSGDIFDYSWNEQDQMLSGYVADIMGHGVGTALQAAALRVLFHQAEEKLLSAGDTLCWVNSKASMYFAEDTFAAAIYFQMDFKRQVASFSVAGINHLFAWTAQQAGLISKPGMFLGLLPDPEYEEHEIPFQSGDTFLFLTDGLFDLITDREAFAGVTPDIAWSLLNALLAENKGTDDASALKIIIK